MKVLVATTETQGRRKNDFSHTNDGELVKFGSECDRESVDGACGCRRAMIGLDSSKATTTFKVIDLDMTRDSFIALLAASDAREGWKTSPEDVAQHADELLRIAYSLPVGQVLERRGSRINGRPCISTK